MNWIKGLKKEGLKPILEIIDEVDKIEWKFWEKHYISLYKSWGFRLTNLTEGGDEVPEQFVTKRDNRKGSTISEWHKKRVGDARRGNNFGRVGENHHNFGKPMSEEQKDKISKALTGGKRPSTWKQIEELDKEGNVIRTYNSVAECAETIGTVASNIAYQCNSIERGRKKNKASKFILRYKKEIINGHTR